MGENPYLVLANQQKCCRFQPKEESSKERNTSGTPLECAATGRLQDHCRCNKSSTVSLHESLQGNITTLPRILGNTLQDYRKQGGSFKRLSWYLNLVLEFIHRVNKSVPLCQSVLVILTDPIAKRTKASPSHGRKHEAKTWLRCTDENRSRRCGLPLWANAARHQRFMLSLARKMTDGQESQTVGSQNTRLAISRRRKSHFERGWTKITPWRPIMKEMSYERETSSTLQARRAVRDCNPRWFLAPIQKLGQCPHANRHAHAHTHSFNPQ